MREASTKVVLQPPEDLPMRYVHALYEGRGVPGAEMELTGILSSHVGVAMATTSVVVTTIASSVVPAFEVDRDEGGTLGRMITFSFNVLLYLGHPFLPS
ncbi:hypothetical protein ZWY2020_053844 [Hordeum vulgare]|nr:hypothetical protein ZWY2020_024596 [Hordeum vulgare]KAI4998502.1 hypothetical protein ZWY2020_053844 [Hordeum vulgare]